MPAAAQEYENGLSIDSVDPAADAAVIARMRKRMDEIHRTQHRPTVGLVLSGGGAKGSAHVGVLKYLEEVGIPVDMICGTSMGGLVGGIAALGYDANYMDSLLRVQDWNIMLTDRIDPRYFSYARKIYRESFQLSIPFHYAQKDFQSRIDDQVRYFEDGAKMRFGRNNLASSLPSGYVYGFNVNNLLSSLSVGYQDGMDFAELPIPYFCVAADAVSLKAVNWASGKLKDAMRSTMSIPVLFKPVRSGGMILVDGGIRNNFPVDLARAMGCDIIIGVDLSDEDRSYSEVNNLLDIVMQFVTMLGRNTFIRNVGGTDVFIKPNTVGYNMLSFSEEAIDTLIRRGYVAAQSKDEELREVKALVGDAVTRLQAPPAIDINTHPVRIGAVEFRGLTDSESRFLQRKLGFKVGSYVNGKEMQRMMSIIEATGCFSSVTYSILGKEAPYALVFDCVKGPRHEFGAGVRFDTEDWAAFRFQVGLNTFKLSGFKLNLDTRIGRNQYASVLGSLDVSWLPTVNLEAKIQNTSSTLTTVPGTAGYDTRWWGHSEKLYLSNIKWTNVDFSIGAQYRYYRLVPSSAYGELVATACPTALSGTYAGFFGTGTLYTYDRLYFPTRGVKMSFGYNYDFYRHEGTGFEPLHNAWFNFSSVMRFGDHFAIIPDLHLRALFSSSFSDVSTPGEPSYSIAHQNFVGGMVGDRYIDGQIPFIGFGGVYMAKPLVGVLNLGVRTQFGKNFFVTATGGYFREESKFSDFIGEDILSSVMPTLWGAGLELAYRTPAGPLRVAGTWSDRFHNFSMDAGLYVSFGFDF